MSARQTDSVQWTRRAVTAAVVVASMAFAIADDTPVFGLLVMGVLLVLHKLMRQRWYADSPRWVLNGLLLIVAVFAGLSWVAQDGGRRGIGVSEFAQFLIAVLLVKMLDRRKARDEGQLLTVAVFLALATALTYVGLIVGLMLLVLVALLIDATVRVQLLVASEGDDGPMVGYGGRPPHKRISAIATLGVVGISIVVFLVVPRQLFEGQFGDLRGSVATGSRTGFTDQIRLGGRGIISQSTKPVLDLRLEDSEGNTLGGPGQVQYLRGAVLDTYNEGRWVLEDLAERSHRLKLSAGLTTPFAAPPPRDLSVVTQQVVLRESDRVNQVLFGIWRPYSVQLGTSGMVRRMSGGVLRASASTSQLSYTLWSSQYDVRRRNRRRNIVEPLGLDALNEWAKGVLVGEGIEPDPKLREVELDGRAARALEAAVREQATYTLDQSPVPAGRDPIEWFMFESQRGHCEYFASALAGACRAVGIDSRVVAGYVAVEFNTTGGYYLVRESNAHAWVEVSIGGEVWITLDPTPPGDLREIHVPKATVFSRLSNLMQAFEYAWVTKVVDFGGGQPGKRSEQMLTAADLDAQDQARAKMKLNWKPWAAGIGVLAVGWVVVLVVRRFIGRRASPEPTELVPLWRIADRALSRAGVACPSWRGRLEHADAVSAVSQEAGDSFARFVRAMYRTRFDASQSPTLGECRTLLDDFCAQIRVSRTPSDAPSGR